MTLPQNDPTTRKNLEWLANLAARGISGAEIQGKMSGAHWDLALDQWYTNDSEMLKLKNNIRKLRLSNTDCPVLITGPTGTGKEKLARVFEVKGKPFVAINCGGLAKDLIPSLFFGHKKGTFTGAIDDRKGYLEEAEDGVIFLDEIAEFPLELQSTLLRAMQEMEIYPVGSSKPRDIKCRFVAATKHKLREQVALKTFRDDLFARLYTFELKVTSLKNRYEDIAHIAEKAYDWPHPITDTNAIQDIYDFNVRGIKTYVERMKIYGSY